MSVTIEYAFEDFLLACRSVLSKRTTQWYADHLKEFVQRQDGAQIDQVQPFPIRQYFLELRESPTHYRAGHQVQGSLSPETIRGRHRAFRRFFNWCITEYDLDPKVNPMRKIKGPMPVEQEPKGINLDDLQKMIDMVEDSPAGKRDRAILYFLIDTGCRAGGLLTLTPDKLMIDEGRAVVTEKGNRTRVVPFTPSTAVVLREWMAIRPSEASTVFCRFGTIQSEIGKPLSNSALGQIMRRLAIKAGVEGRFNPHSFRHGVAREFLRAGGSMAALQQLLGHRDPHITMRFYARYGINELAAQQGQYSPVRSLQINEKMSQSTTDILRSEVIRVCREQPSRLSTDEVALCLGWSIAKARYWLHKAVESGDLLVEDIGSGWYRWWINDK